MCGTSLQYKVQVITGKAHVYDERVARKHLVLLAC